MIAGSSPLIPALGLSLMHFLWQGCLVWGLTAFALWLARHAGPRVRYAIGILGLLVCAAMPVLGLVGRLESHAKPSDIPPVVRTLDIPSPKAILAPRVVPFQPLSLGLEDRLLRHMDLVVLAWLVGIGLLSLRILSGLFWVRRQRRGSGEPVPSVWQRRMLELAARMGVTRALCLRVSASIDTPMVLGWWRPVILFPLGALTGMDASLLEALLAHELAHVKRLDYLVNLLQRGLETTLFYHPAVWWISRQVRQERELICDECAAKTLGEPRRLVLALQELDRFQLSTPHLAQAAHGGNLMRRIRNLIQPDTQPFSWNGLLPTAGIAILALAGSVLAAHSKDIKAPVVRVSEKENVLKGPIQQFAFGKKDEKGLSGHWNTRHAKEIEALQAKLGPDVLWFREKGVSYVITDPSSVARAREIHRPVDELGGEMGRVGGKMGDAGGRMGDLGGQMGTLGGRLGEIGGRMGTVGGKMGTVQGRLHAPGLSDSERQGLETELQALKGEMQSLKEEMAKAQAEMKPQMEALKTQMKEQKEPMKALSSEMRALGQKMKEASRQANDQIVQLIQEARKAGKASKAADQLK